MLFRPFSRSLYPKIACQPPLKYSTQASMASPELSRTDSACSSPLRSPGSTRPSVSSNTVVQTLQKACACGLVDTAEYRTRRTLSFDEKSSDFIRRTAVQVHTCLLYTCSTRHYCIHCCKQTFASYDCTGCASLIAIVVRLPMLAPPSCAVLCRHLASSPPLLVVIRL